MLPVIARGLYWLVFISLISAKVNAFNFIAKENYNSSTEGRISNVLEANSLENPIEILSSPVLTVLEHATYSYAVLVEYPNVAYFLTQAPVGMEIDNSTGVITWSDTANQVGRHPVSILVSHSVGYMATQEYFVEVVNVNEPPRITSEPQLFVLENSLYTYQLEATDAEGDSLTYAMTKAPEGAIFDANSQQASWTPNVEPGLYDFEFTVTDAEGLVSTQSFAIEVLSNERTASHEGTDFWLPISINMESEATNVTGGTFDVNLVSHGKNTEVVLEIAALGISENLSLIADQITTYSFDLDQLAESEIFHLNKVLPGYALHISSSSPISAYLMNQKASTTDGFLGLPKASLGKEYIATTYIMLGRLGIMKTVDGGQYGPIVTLVATEDNTQVVIDPIMDILPGDQRQVEAGTPITLVLNRGDVYNLETKGSYKADLTGTTIKADKPISVIGQMECVYIPSDTGACDHIVEQLPPIESLGTEYFTAPLWGRADAGMWYREYGDIIRVVAPYDNTEVYLNQVLSARLNQGEFHEFIASSPQHIRTSQPVSVTQFSIGDQYDARYSRELPKDFTDPFMVMVSPSEQFLKQYTFSTPARDLTYNFVNLIVPKSSISSLSIDGQLVNGDLFTEIDGTSFSFVQLPVTTGAHHLEADEAFGVYIYGYDYFESYGYLGGMAFSVPSAATSLKLLGGASQTLDNEMCIEAIVLDEFSRPVHGSRVKFELSGASSGTTYKFSDSEGVARYCYRAPQIGEDNITASINGLVESLNVSWLEGIQNQAPVVTSIPNLEVVQDASYTYQVSAVDSENEELTYDLLEAPTGMTIDEAGLLAWPSASFSSVRFNREKVTVSVTDPHGLESIQKFELTKFSAFNTAPTFEAATIDLKATVGVPYIYNLDWAQHSLQYPKYRIEVNDVDEDAVFVDILQGPAEARIPRMHWWYTRQEWHRSCVACKSSFKWIPERAGSEVFELGIRDARGAVGESVTFTVEVSSNTAPTFASFNPPSVAAVGYKYTYVLDIDNDVQPLEYDNLDDLRVVFEQAPTNMRSELVRANDTQKLRIFWTPSSREEGLHTVRLRVDDRLNSSETKEFTINVVSDNQPPVIASSNMPKAEATISYHYQLNASDPDGDKLTYSLLVAPDGMTIDSETGLISWLSPTVISNSEHKWVRFLVTDEFGLSTEGYALLHIVEFNNRAPKFVPAYRPKFAKVGVEYVHQVTATDREGDLPIVYSISSYSNDVGIDPQNGTIRWTPTEEGRFWINAKAKDSLGNYASRNSQTWYVEVLPADATLDATLTLSPTNIIDLGETLTLSILPTNEASSVRVDLTVDGEIVPVNEQLKAEITPNRMGKLAVVAQITDGYETVERTIDIFVRDPNDNTPVISSEPSLNAKLGYAYHYQVVATDIEGDMLSYQLVNAPSGMSISAEGLITWEPLTQESVTVTVRVADNNSYVEQSWQINVLSLEAQLSASLVLSSQSVNEGDIVNVQVVPINAVAPLTISASLDGHTLVLDENNSTQITASGIGQHTLEAIVTDVSGTVTVSSFFFVRDPNANLEPIIESIPLTKAKTESIYQYQIVAMDPDGDALTYTIAGAPNGMTIDATGFISWQATEQDVGLYQVTIEVSDTENNIAQQIFNLSVTAPGIYNRRFCRATN